MFFPSSYKKNQDFEKIDTQNTFLRGSVIKNLESKSKRLIITYPEAIFEKVLEKNEIKKKSLKIFKGQKISLESLNEKLFEFNFTREDFILKPGEFSVRGGIIDVFSFSNKLPFRIEFYGDEIESLRTFEINRLEVGFPN